MHLTDEQKDIGKVNFQAAIGSSLTRRDFLHEANAGKLRSGEGLGSHYFGYGETVDEPVKVAVLGTGDEGSVLIGAINPDYVQVVAIADIRPYNQHRAFHGDYYSSSAMKVRPGLMKVYEWETEEKAREEVKVYEDYVDLLKNAKDIEAVIIALPLHLHAPAAIAAMKAGKHVLTEKLMAHSVHECKEMALVAKETGLLLATGHQRHYNILYDNAVKLIGAGVLGDLHYIRAQWHRGNLPGKDSWQQPMPESVKPTDPLATKLAAELASFQGKLRRAEADLKKDPKSPGRAEAVMIWKGRTEQKTAQILDETIRDKAAGYGYTAKQIKDAAGNVVYDRPAMEELIRWRLWDRTGGGLMAELGSHQLDAASIFIAAMHGGEKQYPLSVAAMSHRPLFPPDRDVDDHVYCLFEFPAPGYDSQDPVAARKKISVAYASINGNGFGGYGETVFGTKGTLKLDREEDAMLFRTHEVDKEIRVTKDKASGKPTIILDDGGDPLSTGIGAQAVDAADRGYREQIEHWAWCIRNPAPENQPRCHPKVALGDAVIALTTNLAARKGEQITFDPNWFEPTSDATPEGIKPDISRYA